MRVLRPQSALALGRANKGQPSVAKRRPGTDVDDIAELAFANDQRQHRSTFLSHIPHRALEVLAAIKASARVLVTARAKLGEVDARAFVVGHPFGGHSAK